MSETPYQPLFGLTRGGTLESLHFGAIAVVKATGDLVAWYGNPHAVTFLRSSAKPFQALPFIEHGGQATYNLTPREIALICASHSGTDQQVAVVEAIQVKTGVAESDLLCGVHFPYDEPTAEALRERNEQPTPNRHNCSGKHTGMLAFTHMLEQEDEFDAENLPYIDPRHPIQREILKTLAEMCRMPVSEVKLGTDGCSAPNFAVPLERAALAYARLSDPVAGQVRPQNRAAACRTITSSMMFNPDMVAGPGRFDTRLMEVGQGKIVAKGGAEGYQAIGLLPGAMGANSPALGIALKISDGDLKSRARSAVTLEVLHQLGALSSKQLDLLAEFGPRRPIYNWRKIEVGESHPNFQLIRDA
jgi:L-asparaginase II